MRSGINVMVYFKPGEWMNENDNHHTIMINPSQEDFGDTGVQNRS